MIAKSKQLQTHNKVHGYNVDRNSRHLWPHTTTVSSDKLVLCHFICDATEKPYRH